ncbi:MAG: hypothetical protein M0R74_05055 [Dehalococcoidia bacterium]|nr:hypothetical protein [Dehalococcoidia bacterium]
MNIALTAGERSGQSTVCRFSEPSLEAVEASVARLRSWAVVREVQLAGSPFVRLNGAERMVIHLPIVGCADPRPETGVIPGRLQPGKTAAVEHVSFARAVELAPTLADQLDRACGLSGPVEFHAVGGSFEDGTLVFPVMDAPASAVRQEFAEVL